MIQLQFLNKVLQTGDAHLITQNNIDSSFFNSYKNEFDFIKTHLDRYGTIPDQSTFADKFPEFDFISVNETDNYLLDELFANKNAHTMIQNFNKVKQTFNSGDINGAMKLYSQGVESISKNNPMETTNILQDTSRYESYLDKLQNHSKYFVSTGFPELDVIMGGWDRSEELATIVARPNVGKSFIALKCALASVEQGLRVGFYSGEMSEEKVACRIDTLISHISNFAINKGESSVQNSYKAYIESLPTRFPKTAAFEVLTPKGLGGNFATVSNLRTFIEQKNLDILFIDQYSLLEDERGGRTTTEKTANLSKDLKNLQVSKKIPIIAVSQQNREKNEEGPDVSNIAQSDRIGQDSTSVIFLQQKDGFLDLHLVKSRDSNNNKKLRYSINLNSGNFDYKPEEDDGNPRENKCTELIEAYEEDKF